ncbi:hypothetical protein [Nonomuraea wenchangensis]|uniref:hypothetical protein n=1 Tax=Nonomuraea wenchangensis TaxID=568860 RepID=UPI00331D81BD
MTDDPTTPALYALEAERLRPTRDETPANPMRELIALLDRMLTDPGPPDLFPLPPTDTEETPNG